MSRLCAISQCSRVEPVADVYVLHVGVSGRSMMTPMCHPKRLLCAQLAGGCPLLVTVGAQRDVGVYIYSLWGSPMRDPTEVWMGRLGMFIGAAACC